MVIVELGGGIPPSDTSQQEFYDFYIRNGASKSLEVLQRYNQSDMYIFVQLFINLFICWKIITPLI